jgi:hypothetical protein
MQRHSRGNRSLVSAAIVLAAAASWACQAPVPTTGPIGTPVIDPNATAHPSPTPVPGGPTEPPTNPPGPATPSPGPFEPSPSIEIPPPIE